jgi:hypothetical protein
MLSSAELKSDPFRLKHILHCGSIQRAWKLSEGGGHLQGERGERAAEIVNDDDIARFERWNENLSPQAQLPQQHVGADQANKVGPSDADLLASQHLESEIP